VGQVEVWLARTCYVKHKPGVSQVARELVQLLHLNDMSESNVWEGPCPVEEKVVELGETFLPWEGPGLASKVMLCQT